MNRIRYQSLKWQSLIRFSRFLKKIHLTIIQRKKAFFYFSSILISDEMQILRNIHSMSFSADSFISKCIQFFFNFLNSQFIIPIIISVPLVKNQSKNYLASERTPKRGRERERERRNYSELTILSILSDSFVLSR